MKSDPQEAHKKRRYAQRRFINSDSEALVKDRKKIQKIRKKSQQLALDRLVTAHHQYKWSYQMRLIE
jgi:hypothetical protein